MKKILLALVALLTTLLMINPLSVSADNEDRVVDYAVILTSEEEQKLEQELKILSDKYQMEFVVLTTNDNENKGTQYYAADFYDYNGYGYGTNHDGILLIVDFDDRIVQLIATGKGIQVFYDDMQDWILDSIWNYVENGDYYNVFHYFGIYGEKAINSYYNSAQEPVIETPQKDLTSAEYWGYIIKKAAPLALGTGGVIALIVVLIMAAKNKSVSAKTTAFNYAIPGTFHMFGHYDIFLHRDVRRRRIERDNDGGSGSGHHSSTFKSSSGRSHSSSGGRHF